MTVTTSNDRLQTRFLSDVAGALGGGDQAFENRATPGTDIPNERATPTELMFSLVLREHLVRTIQ